MNLSFKTFDNLRLYLSLKVGVHFMNSQHLRLKWHLKKLDKYGPRFLSFILACNDILTANSYFFNFVFV